MAALDDLAESVVATVEDLRELSRGLHPAILASGGLRPALATLVRGSMVPARLNFTGEVDVPEGAEIAAFYVVSEALTNIAKHAAAQQVQVDVSLRSTELHLRVADDGCGGAALGGGTGLIGLTDRVQALGGDLEIVSSPKTGTALTAIIPYVHSSLHDSVSAARHPTTDPSR